MSNVYILNSAVLTSFGCYCYHEIKPEEAKRILSKGYISTIGYEETALALSELLGLPIPVNRTTIKMQVGEKAIVFRLVLPPGSPRIDPKDKGQIMGHIKEGHWELGLLVREE